MAVPEDPYGGIGVATGAEREAPKKVVGVFLRAFTFGDFALKAACCESGLFRIEAALGLLIVDGRRNEFEPVTIRKSIEYSGCDQVEGWSPTTIMSDLTFRPGGALKLKGDDGTVKKK